MSEAQLHNLRLEMISGEKISRSRDWFLFFMWHDAFIPF
jgi:hypothetical protein